jgi:signal peptidase I
MNTDANRKKPVWREYLESIILALVIAMFIRTFFFQAFKIPSESMLNTLLIGDHLLVNKFIYGTRIPFTHIMVIKNECPAHGDIIVFEYPKNTSLDYIKRVIGMPGDIIHMRDKVVYRNGQQLDEPYAIHGNTSDSTRDNFSEITVPPDKYFVMGDNRENSADSRHWGFVPREAIHGKAWRMYWSWENPFNIRWSRLGKLVE